MDAKTFFEEAHRMCDKQDSCGDCPIRSKDYVCTLKGVPFQADTTKAINEAIDAVEQWAKEHPRKTRFADFLEKYPNAPLNAIGKPKITPWYLGYCGDTPCYACDKAKDKPLGWCWDQEVEEK